MHPRPSSKTEIQLEEEPKPWDPSMERCCMCRTPTRTWVKLNGKVRGDSVACCSRCATEFHLEDLPTKASWVKRERHLQTHPTRDA